MRKNVVNFQSIKQSIGNILQDLYAAAYAGIKIYTRYPAWIAADLISTPMWVLILLIPILLFLPRESWGDPTTYQFFFWGMVMWDIVSMALWSFGTAIRREQQLGTLEFLFVSNANRLVMFARIMVSRLISFTISTLYLALIIQILFGHPLIIRNLVLVILTLILGLLASSGFGAMYGALVLRLKNVEALNNILQFMFIGISGLFFPIERLPPVIRVIAYFLPFTYLADLVRYAALGTETIIDPYIEYILLIAMVIFFNLLGSILFKKVEKNTKKTGKLGVY